MVNNHDASVHRYPQYFMSAKKLNRRQARWSLFLSRFDFSLHHRPGRTMGKSDALSRRPDHGTGSGDNSNITLLKPEFFAARALSGFSIHGDERSILDAIKTGKDNDEFVVKAVQELKKGKGRSLRAAEWAVEDGLIYFRGKVYVPRDSDLRRRIVEQHHDSAAAGHPGRFKTLELVSRNYWWPQMSRYIGQYTRHCDLCNRAKTIR